MSSNKKVKGAAKNETMQDKIAKAREKKEAAKERKQGKEPNKPQSSNVPKVQRNAKDKKMANFLHQASSNREKQRASKKAQLERMQAKLVQIREAKEQDSDEDEGDEGDDEMPDGEEEEGDEEEELALQEFEGEVTEASEPKTATAKKRKKQEVSLTTAEDEDDDEDEEEGGGLTEVASMEDLKKKFSGKRVPSVEVMNSYCGFCVHVWVCVFLDITTAKQQQAENAQKKKKQICTKDLTSGARLNKEKETHQQIFSYTSTSTLFTHTTWTLRA